MTRLRVNRPAIAMLGAIALVLGAIGFGCISSFATAQDLAASADDVNRDDGDSARTGYLLDMPDPLTADAAERLLASLTRLANASKDASRVTVVIRYPAEENLAEETSFEDALRFARAITQPELRQVRVVAWVRSRVSGHMTLPILASDVLLVSSSGEIANATAREQGADETIEVSYRSIAARRGLFSPEVVAALVDPSIELARITKVDGAEMFAAGDQLVELRESGQVASESIWSEPDTPLNLNASQLRSARVSAGVVGSLDQVAELLDLAKITPLDQSIVVGEPAGRLLEIVGVINAERSRRWQSNLTATLQSNEVNTWVLGIDSPGGSLSQSATLAGWFSQPEPPLQKVVGLVQGEARGDAALIAVSCRPLYMKPSATLGGPGAEAIDSVAVERNDELIEQIARNTNRPAALIRGILDPQLEVYRYTNLRTGRIHYATEEDLVRGVEDAAAERAKWERGELIDLAVGLTAARAIELGLADGEANSLDEVSRRAGLVSTPPPVLDRGLVRFVERLGRNQGLAFLLLFIGFAALSTEANAPGLGVPGFIAIVCFALYFWIKFLSGTAEWLELLAFALGLIFIGIEIFVLPGFGIFGVGGLALTVLGIVLMSQTFVIPKNVYQLEVLTRGVWSALGAVIAMIATFVLMRMMMPRVPILRGLAMEVPDGAALSESEKLADYSNLLNQLGTTTTPLRPAGKAIFGDAIVQVISNGTAIGSGETVQVVEVRGTRIVVEAPED